jgi:hypothetical protein
MAQLSAYEISALQQVQDYKDRSMQQSTKNLMPDGLKQATSARARKLKAAAETVPGYTKAVNSAARGYLRAAEGLNRGVSKTSAFTLSERRVIKAYTKRGQQIGSLSDIRSLDLEVVEKRVWPRGFSFFYAAASGAEGAATGFAITGGEVISAGGGIAGGGAGAAPGVGTVTAVMAADAAAVLGVCTRVVSHTSLYYGYDPSDPAEAIYQMGILNLGTAVTSSSRYAAFAELSTITQQLMRSAPWVTLNQHVLVKIIDRFARLFGVRLTKTKLGQIVPVAGIAIGAGLNYFLVDQVADAAYWSYRERFINEKRGFQGLYVPQRPKPDGDDEENIDVVGLVQEAIDSDREDR